MKTKCFFLLLLSIATSIETIYASNTQVNGIWYDFDSNTKTASVTYRGTSCSSYHNEYSGTVTIPSSVTYNSINYSVTSIGYSAFEDCTGLTSITIPNSVTSIGEEAFFDCNALSSITIPNSVVIINERAFAGCRSINSITIPNSITSISMQTFDRCTGLTSITIPNSVTSIGSWCFHGCSSLTSITIPNGVTRIEESVFSGCSNMTSITIGNGVKWIEIDAFRDCTGLQRVNILDLTAWISINFESNPLTYAHHLYLNGNELTHLTIPDGITNIKSGIFNNCKGLKSLTIPSCVAIINRSAFSGCDSLKKVEILSDSILWQNYSSDDFSVANFFGKQVEEYILNNNATSIEPYFFNGCSRLKSVTIPSSITRVGYNAFRGCTGLQRVNISDLTAWFLISFENYESNPLFNAHHLYMNGSEITHVTVPNAITNVKERIFYNCTGLEAVTIPNHVKAIGEGAFVGCHSVIISSDSVLSRKYSENNSFYNIFGNQVTDYLLEEGITKIGEYAFSKCNKMTSISIPSSVTCIEANAFNGCSRLTAVNISDIASWCSISFASNPISYAHHLYLDGNEVSDLIIPNSVTSIGESAFSGCSCLASVSIPNSVTSIDEYAFSECSSLASVSIPNSVTNIGEYAFSGCGLTSLIIPNSIQSIARHSFRGCGNLTSVSFGTGLKEILIGAFYECNNIQAITCHSVRPPSVAEPSGIIIGAFSDLPLSTIVYVPEESYNAYYMHNFWGKFDVRVMDNSALEEVFDDYTLEELLANPETQVFTLQGNDVTALRNNLPAGVYILRHGNTSSKVTIR